MPNVSYAVYNRPVPDGEEAIYGPFRFNRWTRWVFLARLPAQLGTPSRQSMTPSVRLTETLAVIFRLLGEAGNAPVSADAIHEALQEYFRKRTSRDTVIVSICNLRDALQLLAPAVPRSRIIENIAVSHRKASYRLLQSFPLPA